MHSAACKETAALHGWTPEVALSNHTQNCSDLQWRVFYGIAGLCSGRLIAMLGIHEDLMYCFIGIGKRASDPGTCIRFDPRHLPATHWTRQQWQNCM